MGLTDGIAGIIENNPIASTVGAAAIGIGVGVGASAIVGSISSKKTRTSARRKHKKHTKRGWKQDRARFNKSQKWEVAYRKHKRKHHKKSHKSKSKKGIHYTKKGQPYKIMANGRARFIKK